MSDKDREAFVSSAEKNGYGRQTIGYPAFAHGWQAARNYYAPKLSGTEVAELITSAVKSEAFALEGFPIKPLFAENLLGKAAVKALRAAGIRFKEEA